MTDQEKHKDRAPEDVKGKVEESSEGQPTGEPVPGQEAELPSELEALKARIAELEKSVEQYKDQFLRKAAEFENYKKRVENDYVKLTRYASEDIILELLPVLDDVERSLKAGKDRREFGPFYKGVELIYSKLMKILEAQGLKPIDALGQEFNVDYHEALMQMPKENAPPHTVIEEVEKGYMLYDKVIRHTKVVVAGNNEKQTGQVQEKKDETQKKDEKDGKEKQ